MHSEAYVHILVFTDTGPLMRERQRERRRWRAVPYSGWWKEEGMSSVHTKCGILISLTICMRGCKSGPIQATQWQPQATEECNSLRGVSALWDNIEQIGIQKGFASGLNSKTPGRVYSKLAFWEDSCLPRFILRVLGLWIEEWFGSGWEWTPQCDVNHMSMWWDQLHQPLPTWVGCWCEFCHRASSLSSLFFTERMQWSTATETILGGPSNSHPGPFRWIRLSSILSRSLPSDPSVLTKVLFFRETFWLARKRFLLLITAKTLLEQCFSRSSVTHIPEYCY